MWRTLVLIPLVATLAGCAGLAIEDIYEPPTFSHDRTRLTGLDWSSLTGRSTVELHNPNPVSLPISRFEAELWLDGEPWIDLGAPQLDGLAAEASTRLDFDWDLSVSGLAERARAAYDAGEAVLELRLNPTLEVPVLGARQVDWQHSFTVPVPKAPRVRLVDWQVESLSLSEITVALDLEIDNPNRFNLSAGPWDLAVVAGDRRITSLNLDAIGLSAGEQHMQRSRVTLGFGALGPNLLTSLRSGQWPRDLSLDWQGRMSSPELGLELPSLEGRLSM